MESLHTYFWSFVTRTDSCWLWTGRSLNHGYGQLWVNGRRWIASRLAYHLTYGHIPRGMCVCHHCDVPACVRPDHLFLAKQAQNLADMRRKDRGRLPPIRRGQANNRAKLTPRHVADIRTEYAKGASLRQLGRKYSVWHTTIRQIIHSETWRHHIT